MSIVKKKKRVSKKNKKAWGKYCDIKDVEDFLEDQRLEERLGKFDVKPDSEIFVVDTEGDIKDAVVEEKKPLSLKLQKRAKLKEQPMPKCFEILMPSSKANTVPNEPIQNSEILSDRSIDVQVLHDVRNKPENCTFLNAQEYFNDTEHQDSPTPKLDDQVQDPNAKRNRVNPIGSKATALSKLTVKRKTEKKIFEKKLDEAKKNRKMAIDKKRKAKKVRENFDLDLWNIESLEAKGIPETLIDEFISTEAQLHNVLTHQRLRPKPPIAKTVATRAAVELPHPGVSYNPSYKEHQELLQEVGKHEEKMIKREAHLNRVTTGMFRKVTQQEKENQWKEEMSAGLPRPDNPSNDPPSDADTDNEYKSINPPVKNKKKDHKARRKQREQLVEKERLKRAKIDKKKITDLYKLRKLQSSIVSNEQTQATERGKRAEKRAVTEATALPTLSAHKTPKREPEFVDPTTLSGDLRNVQGKTNLLRDRFESFQRRGALAASKVMMKKKKKIKTYFKAGHKVTDNDIDKFLKRSAGKK